MKKISKIFFLSILLSILFVSCSKTNYPKEALKEVFPIFAEGDSIDKVKKPISLLSSYNYKEKNKNYLVNLVWKSSDDSVLKIEKGMAIPQELANDSTCNLIVTAKYEKKESTKTFELSLPKTIYKYNGNLLDKTLSINGELVYYFNSFSPSYIIVSDEKQIQVDPYCYYNSEINGDYKSLVVSNSGDYLYCGYIDNDNLELAEDPYYGNALKFKENYEMVNILSLDKVYDDNGKYYIKDRDILEKLKNIMSINEYINLVDLRVEGGMITFDFYYEETLIFSAKYYNVRAVGFPAPFYHYDGSLPRINEESYNVENEFTITSIENISKDGGSYTNPYSTWEYTDSTYLEFNESIGCLQIGTSITPNKDNFFSIYTEFSKSVTLVGFSVTVSANSGESALGRIEYGGYTTEFTITQEDLTTFSDRSLKDKTNFFKISFKANGNTSIYLKKLVIEYSEEELEDNEGLSTVTSQRLGEYENFKDNLTSKEVYGTMPSIGTYEVLIIPVEFSDYLFQPDDLYWLNLTMNGYASVTSIPYQSVTDYYKDASNGLLNLSFNITAKYEFSQESEFYTYLSSSKKHEILRDILRSFDDTIDYSKYDSDNDGYIDSVLFVYSRLDIEFSTTWWASCDSDKTRAKFDGVSFHAYMWGSIWFIYQMTPSEDTFNTNPLVYIHEIGHLLGLQDFYLSSGSSSPIGKFDIMSTYFGLFGPFDLLHMGWANPYLVNTGISTINLTRYEETSDFILIPFNNDKFNKDGIFSEYLLIMYYTPTGRYLPYLDTDLLPYESGIVIYHIDARMKIDFYNFYDAYYFHNAYADDNFIEILETDFNGTIYDDGVVSSDLLREGKVELDIKYYWHQGGRIEISIEIKNIGSSGVTLEIINR